MRVADEEAPPKYDAPAAVIRRGQALAGFIWCKGRGEGIARWVGEHTV